MQQSAQWQCAVQQKLEGDHDDHVMTVPTCGMYSTTNIIASDSSSSQQDEYTSTINWFAQNPNLLMLADYITWHV